MTRESSLEPIDEMIKTDGMEQFGAPENSIPVIEIV